MTQRRIVPHSGAGDSAVLRKLVDHIVNNDIDGATAHIHAIVDAQQEMLSQRVMNIAVAEAALRLRGDLVERLIQMQNTVKTSALHASVVQDVGDFLTFLKTVPPNHLIAYTDAARRHRADRLYDDTPGATTPLDGAVRIFGVTRRASTFIAATRARPYFKNIDRILANLHYQPSKRALPAADWAVGDYQKLPLLDATNVDGRTYTAPPSTTTAQSDLHASVFGLV